MMARELKAAGIAKKDPREFNMVVGGTEFQGGVVSANTTWHYTDSLDVDRTNTEFDFSGYTPNAVITADPAIPPVTSFSLYAYTEWKADLFEVNGFDCELMTGLHQAFYFCVNLTKFTGTSFQNITDPRQAFYGCSSLEEIDGLDFSGVVGHSFYNTWKNCTSLVSFKNVDCSNTTGVFNGTWDGCTALVTFENVNMGSGTAADFTSTTFRNCTALKYFKNIDVGSTPSMNNVFGDMDSLEVIKDCNFALFDGSLGTSGMIRPTLKIYENNYMPLKVNITVLFKEHLNLERFVDNDFSSVETLADVFNGSTALQVFTGNIFPAAASANIAWSGCTSLTTFSGNDISAVTVFTNAWTSCILNSASVEDILVRLDTTGLTSKVTTIGTDGTSLTVNAQAAYDSLIGKSWTVTIEDNS